MRSSTSPDTAATALLAARQRRLDARSLALFSEGQEIRLNPDVDWLRQALDRVQARARTNRLSREQAAEALHRVTIGGETSACAGLKDCPSSFRFPITTTQVVVARLTNDLIACSVGRRAVMPGRICLPPVCADPIDEPQRWLREVVTAFWTRLDGSQIERLRRTATARTLAIAAADVGGSWRERAFGRAAAKRRLQVEQLFRTVEPAYVTELDESLRRIIDELVFTGRRVVTWREFQRRWPSIATRYRRDLLQAFRQGSTDIDALASTANASQFWLSFDTWDGPQTIFCGTQLVMQVCSDLLSAEDASRDSATDRLVRQLRAKASNSSHPATAETVGWLCVHLDDHHRLAFIDEVQSDVAEHLLAASRSDGDPSARALLGALGEWSLHGFSTVARWAASIGYRTAIHSEASAACISGKTPSVRKWSVYYASLIKRQGLELSSFQGYRAPIWVMPAHDASNWRHDCSDL